MTRCLPLIPALVAMTAIAGATSVSAQTASPSSASPAAQLGMYVFPAKSQDTNQQHLDELHCYDWSKQKTNFDPLAPAAPATASSSEPTTGRRAARGAAAGAAIGAIAGNAGAGAAAGATAGALRGMHRRNQASEQQAAADQQTAALTNDFKKAFAACLEGKGYTVK